MTERHAVAEVDDLPDDGSHVFIEIEGIEIAVFRINGEFLAAANYCVHQGGPLCEGELRGRYDVDDSWEWVYDDEEKNIVCPWHGWKFDLTTGQSLTDERYTVPTYDVEVDDRTIYLVR